jgi:hypothetical protein
MEAMVTVILMQIRMASLSLKFNDEKVNIGL